MRTGSLLLSESQTMNLKYLLRNKRLAITAEIGVFHSTFPAAAETVAER